MELMQAIESRTSTRAFTDREVTPEQLETVVRAAMLAPTCMGQFEKMHLTVVKDAAVIARLNSLFGQKTGQADAAPCYGAQALIYVSASDEDPDVVAGANAGCMMENMLLAATGLGLGSVFLFGVSEALRGEAEPLKLLEIPAGFHTVAAIALGYPADGDGKRAKPAPQVGANQIG